MAGPAQRHEVLLALVLDIAVDVMDVQLLVALLDPAVLAGEAVPFADVVVVLLAVDIAWSVPVATAPAWVLIPPAAVHAVVLALL